MNRADDVPDIVKNVAAVFSSATVTGTCGLAAQIADEPSRHARADTQRNRAREASFAFPFDDAEPARS